MRYLLPIVFLSILHCVLAVQLLHISSNCTETVNVWESITGIIAKLDAGQHYTHELSRGRISFKNGAHGLAYVSFGIDSMWPRTDEYWATVIHGFDTGFEVTSTKGDGVITCRNEDCFEDSIPPVVKYYSVPTGGDFSLMYCP